MGYATAHRRVRAMVGIQAAGITAAAGGTRSADPLQPPGLLVYFAKRIDQDANA